jgi:hypothetical protein
MPRPIIHHRDHEHGGADPVRIQWEQTGESGGGTGSLGQGTYNLDSGTDHDGGMHLFQWSHSSGDALLDLTDDYHPSVLTAGVYAYNFIAAPGFTYTFLIPAGSMAMYEFIAAGSSGMNAAFGENFYQSVETAIPYPPSFLNVSGSVVVHQDPASDDGAYAWMGVASIFLTEAEYRFTGSVLVQKVV